MTNMSNNRGLGSVIGGRIDPFASSRVSEASSSVSGRETEARGEGAEEVSLRDVDAGQRLRVMNVSRAVLLADRLRLALDSWRRLRGLLGGPPLAEGEAMLLRPCASVHTCFMGYVIDVLFLDEAGRIVAMRQLRPWRFSPIYGAALATLEFPAGLLETSGSQVGDRIAFLGEGC